MSVFSRALTPPIASTDRGIFRSPPSPDIVPNRLLNQLPNQFSTRPFSVLNQIPPQYSTSSPVMGVDIFLLCSRHDFALILVNFSEICAEISRFSGDSHSKIRSHSTFRSPNILHCAENSSPTTIPESAFESTSESVFGSSLRGHGSSFESKISGFLCIEPHTTAMVVWSFWSKPTKELAPFTNSNSKYLPENFPSSKRYRAILLSGIHSRSPIRAPSNHHELCRKIFATSLTPTSAHSGL